MRCMVAGCQPNGLSREALLIGRSQRTKITRRATLQAAQHRCFHAQAPLHIQQTQGHHAGAEGRPRTTRAPRSPPGHLPTAIQTANRAQVPALSCTISRMLTKMLMSGRSGRKGTCNGQEVPHQPCPRDLAGTEDALPPGHFHGLRLGELCLQALDISGR